MSFILYSKFFDIIISILIILNAISTFIISTKDLKKELKEERGNDKFTKLETFKGTSSEVPFVYFMFNTYEPSLFSYL